MLSGRKAECEARNHDLLRNAGVSGILGRHLEALDCTAKSRLPASRVFQQRTRPLLERENAPAIIVGADSMTARNPFAERGGAVRGVLDLASGCYPAFLFGGSIGRMLPVFHFHDVTRDSFEPPLQYLAENGYRTVMTDEIARLVIDGISPGPRAIALTFDDAWRSVWTVAMPLLRRSGLRAILFAIPGRVSDAATVRPTIDDNAAAALSAVSSSPFATWPELRAMHASGVFDIQSHTRTHAMIFSHDQIVDFVTPEYTQQPLLNRPVAGVDGAATFVEPQALGTPLYAGRSRMSDARRFLPDPRTAERCREHVTRNGGAAFFARSGWRRELEALAETGRGAFEDDQARATWIRDELVEGRELLNGALGTTAVRHVALPWGVAGDITRQALELTGHATAFAQRPFERLGVRAGDDRYELTRLNGRFVTCLPGRGRKWLLTAPSVHDERSSGEDGVLRPGTDGEPRTTAVD